MSLIAGKTLILAHIVSHYHYEEMKNLLVHQRMGDRSIIEGILANLKAISAFREDFLSSKCAILFRDLLAVESDAARYQTRLGTSMSTDADDEGKILMIKVPYIGTIRISRDRLTAIPSPGLGSSRDEHEGITIGGIGSMHVKKAFGRDCSDLDEALGVVGSCVYPRQSQTPTPLNFNQIPEPLEQLFPDASAPIDDWVFQGADTAFFDALMKGAGEEQLHSSRAEL